MKTLLHRTIAACSIGVFIYIVLFLFFDRTIDIWMRGFSNTPMYRIGEFFSIFADKKIITVLVLFGIPVSVIYNKVYGTAYFTYIVLLACISLIITEILGGCLKFLLGRYRPVMLFEEGLYGFHYFGTRWALHSTPSGHTGRIFALMASFSLGYRKLTPFFMTFAVLVGCSRIVITAHYPSDVFFGAFLGTVVAVWAKKYADSRKKTMA